jgi:hypothetical protein
MGYLFLGEIGYEMAQNNGAYILDEVASDNDLFDSNGSLARALYNWKRSATQGYTSARLKVSLDLHHPRFACFSPQCPQVFFMCTDFRVAAANLPTGG